jgi:hypothetical protein
MDDGPRRKGRYEKYTIHPSRLVGPLDSIAGLWGSLLERTLKATLGSLDATDEYIRQRTGLSGCHIEYPDWRSHRRRHWKYDHYRYEHVHGLEHRHRYGHRLWHRYGLGDCYVRRNRDQFRDRDSLGHVYGHHAHCRHIAHDRYQ